MNIPRSKFFLLMLALAGLHTGISAAGPGVNGGKLFIVGGGDQPPELPRRFIELAGGTNHSHIVVLPMASEDAAAAGADQVAQFKALGVAKVESIVWTREEAMNPAAAGRLEGATGIYFTGGDQVRLASVLVDSPVHAKLRKLHTRGVVIGGTSAGAAIMSEIMITGDERLNADKENAFRFIKQGNVATAVGLGFLTNAVIDQHFLKRKRFNRLISVMLEHPQLLGIGIDESTAIIVDAKGEFEVLGEGAVLVIDPRAAKMVRADVRGNLSARDTRMQLLVAGDRFDLRRRRAAFR